jgi:hypothetical protein
MTLTLIFALPTSAARLRVKPDCVRLLRRLQSPHDLPMTPALLAAYPTLPFPSFKPNNEATLIMQPAPSSISQLTPSLHFKTQGQERAHTPTRSIPHHPFPNNLTSQHSSHKIRPHNPLQRLYIRHKQRTIMRDPRCVHENLNSFESLRHHPRQSSTSF